MSVTYNPMNDYVINPINDYVINSMNDLVISPISDYVVTPLDEIVLNDYIVSDRMMSPVTPLEVITDTPPYVTSLNLTYSKPLLGVYENLNASPSVQKKIIRYFQSKTLDKWLLGDLIDTLNYFKINNGKVDVIDSLDDYKPGIVHKESIEQLEKKIDFIENYFLTFSVMDRLLRMYVRESGIQWVKLPRQNEFFVKQLVEDKLKKLIMIAIAEKRKYRKK